MISIVTKWWIKPGNEADAVGALAELARRVEDGEPFTLMYLIQTSLAEGSSPTPPANEVVLVGTWPDGDAFNQHLDGPAFKGWIAQYLALFLTDDGGGLFVVPEFVDRIGGFIRPAATAGVS